MTIAQKVESIRILSPDGTVDKKLEPKLPDEDLLGLYKTMLSSRLFDERCFMLQRQGRIGTYGPTKGQEAASLGFAYCINNNDWFVPAFRETAAMLYRGWPMSTIMLWWGGHEIGATPPKGLNDLPICVPVSSQCQLAMGISWAQKLKKTKDVTLVFVGDGGTSEGDFHEAMNFAGVYKLPLVQVIQNNQWAISIPRHAQTASPTIAQKAIAYGFDAFQVDGNDILACIVAGQEAVKKAREGGGPTIIEAITYRLGVHTTADDPKKYRKDEEVKEWEPKDPLIRFKAYLEKKKLLTDAVETKLREEIRLKLDEATAVAEGYRASKTEFFEYVYAEMTPELRKQKAELEEYLAHGAKPSHANELSRV